MKLTRRKGFNFYRSYYDVFNKLPTDKDKLEFISILLDKQFLDADPSNCSMIVEFAYESQLHSITKQVKGWKDATSLELTDPSSTPVGVATPIPLGDPPKEEQDKVQVQVQGKGELKPHVFNFKKSFLDLGVEENTLSDWLKVRKTKKATNSETAFNGIINQISKSELSANECIKISAEKSWSGFNHEWVNNTNGKTKQDTKTWEAPKGDGGFKIHRS